MKVFSKQLTRILAFSAMVTAFSISAQVVYKVVQEDGTVLYTDQPIPGAEPLSLAGVSSSVAPSLAPTQASAAETDEQEGPNYKIEVVSPSPESTIRDNQGRMAIVARLSPEASGQFHLWLNNEHVASQQSGAFMLDGLNRGAHTFYLTVTDNSGKTLASSDPQTFYMHQASALINSGARQ